jgi:hypothetical protein
VDVIIPVFRDFKRTRDCVESVLTSVNETLLHLVVINDASPESKLTSGFGIERPVRLSN